MVPFKENLLKILTESVEFVTKNYQEDNPQLDHASYQTSDTNVYEEVVAELKKSEKFLKEILYSGRKLSLFELSEPVTVSGNFILYRIEVEEPKPGSKIPTSFWESVSFKVNDFDKTLEENKNTEKELKQVRQIHDQKWGYIEMEGYRVQLRNNFFGIEMMNGVEEAKEEKEADDFKKMFEEEKEKRLMALAEMDNEKKRMEKQREEFMKIANMALLKDIFEVVDDLNRAVLNQSDKDSLNMILNKLLGILNNYGVIPLGVKEGDTFDPKSMEAVSSVSAGEDKINKVVHIDQLGFKLKDDDRVLRTSRVIVGKA